MVESPKIGSHAYFARLHEVEGKHWWSRGMRGIADVMLRREYGRREDLDILDAGCGTGISLTWLGQYSRPKPVVGIDVSEHALAFSRARGHEAVRFGSVTDLPFESACFDLVVCNDVLQHVSDDERALREIHRVLRPGGCLNLRTNAKIGIARAKPQASEDYRMYTREDLNRKLEAAGFEVVQSTHVNALMSVVPAVRRFFRERKESTYGDRGLPIRLLPPHLAWLNPVLHGLLRLEARYLRRPARSLSFGNSMIAMARKPAS